MCKLGATTFTCQGVPVHANETKHVACRKAAKEETKREAYARKGKKVHVESSEGRGLWFTCNLTCNYRDCNYTVITL